jgi:hypothetical protein
VNEFNVKRNTIVVCLILILGLLAINSAEAKGKKRGGSGGGGGYITEVFVTSGPAGYFITGGGTYNPPSRVTLGAVFNTGGRARTAVAGDMPTMEEITVLGQKIIETNDHGRLAEYASDILEALSKGLKMVKKKKLSKLLDIIAEKIEGDFDITYNYCDLSVPGNKTKEHQTHRKYFVANERARGEITFPDVEFAGDSDKIIIIFANGLGTYVYNTSAQFAIIETDWKILNVGC